MTESTRAAAPDRRAARVAAGVLIAAPLLQVLAMAHHPSVHAREPAEVLTQLRALGNLSGIVHGVLIGLVVAALLALLEFSVHRGLWRPLVRSALAAYALGVIFMTGAALVSGFIAPNVTSVNAGVTPSELQQTVSFLVFAMLFNQAFAKCAAILMSLGIVAWSVDLARGTGPARVLGGFGIASGLACALALAAGALHLDVHGMTLVTVVQALWTVGAGIVLLRGAPAR